VARRNIIFVATLSVLLVVALLSPLPWEGRVAAAAADLAHAPTFALVTWLCQRLLLARRAPVGQRVSLSGAILVLATLLEIAQFWSGRDGSVQDGLANLLGVLAGTCLALPPPRADRSVRSVSGLPLGAALLCLALASWYPLRTFLDVAEQRTHFPLLASFETERELGRWSEFHSRLERGRAHVTHGRWALSGTWLPARYPAFIFRYPPADWSGYQSLRLDLYVEPGPELVVTVTVADGQHNREPQDRYHFDLPTTGGLHRLSIPLEEIASGPRHRELDLTDIAWLAVGGDPVDAPRYVALDHVRLE
jgi:VanZ family protein